MTAKVTSLVVSRAFSEGGRQMELGLAGNWRPKEAGGGARQAGRGIPLLQSGDFSVSEAYKNKQDQIGLERSAR